MKRIFANFFMTGFLLFFALTNASAQKYKFKQALKLAISNTSEESYPLASPDTKTLYFTRIFDPDNTGGKRAGSDIWTSSLDPNGVWQSPVLLKKPLNNRQNNLAIGFNPEGDRLFLLNTYRSTSKSDIAFFDLKNEDQKPEIFDVPKIRNGEGFFGLYVHPSEKIILVSVSGEESQGQEDLYVILKDTTDTWLPMQNLGPMINTSGFEISPFLSDDGVTLFFSSDGHGGFGDADIFMAERLYGTWNVWTRPVNLGPNINSDGFDAYFSLSKDKKAYFVSNKDGGFSDIYMAEQIVEADSTTIRIQQLIEDAKKLLNPVDGDAN